MTPLKKFLVLDCYVDEPACFGVPPFLAPYPRYVFGALRDAGVESSRIIYWTIDHLREKDFLLCQTFDAVFVIGGAVVPGKYLHTSIGTSTELQKIVSRNSGTEFFIGGAIGRELIGSDCRNAHDVQGDLEFFAHSRAKGSFYEGLRTPEQIGVWSVLGAEVVAQHPEFPNIICEIETFRGCPRQTKCHFCQEFLRDGVTFRDEDDIIQEIDALIEYGISRFRVGCQPDIIQYGSKLDEYRNGFPRPNPKRVFRLFTALSDRRHNGKIALLNVDNANPGSIVNFPDESSDILQIIADTVTPGDTLALGIESFDERVVRANNLKVSPDEALFAIQRINDIGGRRVNGIPVILPGINLIHGLIKENEETFKLNYEYLKKIISMGLLVKRINIRSVNPIEGTPVAKAYRHPSLTVRKRYEYFREKIRNEIDKEMLKKIYPAGIVLRDLRIEDSHRTYSYARQIASYPITTKIPFPFENEGFFDAVVLNHLERSLVVLPLPYDINTLPHSALKHIPGLGKKGAEKFILKRPFDSVQKIREAFPGVPDWVLKIVH